MTFFYSFKSNNKKSLLALLIQWLVLFSVLMGLLATIEAFRFSLQNITVGLIVTLIMSVVLGLSLYNGFIYIYLTSMAMLLYGFASIPGFIADSAIENPAAFSIMALIVLEFIGICSGAIPEFIKYLRNRPKRRAKKRP
ncbi:MAG: hypothetical protein JXQ26_11625 [Tissierellales bacterium]|nr:hypothetical protein [Tissierellales bacterium]MBN2828636.1 hypothetical protein [Tissierellales bacterium]